MGKRSTRPIGAMALIVAALTIVGCGPAPWNDWADDSVTPTPTVPVVVPPPVANDLSTGSAERTITAGAVGATINYWSSLSMDRWTATALKPVSLSLVATVTPDDGKKVYLQRVSMIAVPGNASQSYEALPAQIDQAPNLQSYAVLSPQSYSQTFNVGEVPSAATFVTLQFTYEFLMQTAPNSNDYSKQTASDSLVVAIAQPADDGK